VTGDVSMGWRCPIGPARLGAAPRFLSGAAAVDLSNATCASTTVDATSGTIWLDSSSGGRVTGAVDAMLADGTHLSGTFNAPGCAIDLPIAELCAGTWVPPAGTCVP
jgi:hypothetical protein